jgi:hypothetical protein
LGWRERLFARSGAQLLDLLSESESEGFYGSYRYRAFAGYRIYPEAATE